MAHRCDNDSVDHACSSDLSLGDSNKENVDPQGSLQMKQQHLLKPALSTSGYSAIRSTPSSSAPKRGKAAEKEWNGFIQGRGHHASSLKKYAETFAKELPPAKKRILEEVSQNAASAAAASGPKKPNKIPAMSAPSTAPAMIPTSQAPVAMEPEDDSSMAWLPTPLFPSLYTYEEIEERERQYAAAQQKLQQAETQLRTSSSSSLVSPSSISSSSTHTRVRLCEVCHQPSARTHKHVPHEEICPGRCPGVYRCNKPKKHHPTAVNLHLSIPDNPIDSYSVITLY